MLHGDALRAEIRRICSLERVMPAPPPPPPPSYGKATESDATMLKRRISLKAAAAKRQEKMVGRKAEALARRPKGTLYREEVCRAIGRSSAWFDRRAKLTGLAPIKQDGFAWFRTADLKQAGIL